MPGPIVRRVLQCVLGLAGVVVLVSAGLALAPWVWPAHPDTSLALENGRLVGRIIGYVWSSDPDTRTIRVSSSLFGLGAIPFTVTSDTRIVIHDKLGGFGDLREHMPVRVVYEVRDNVRMASSIELLVKNRPPAPAMAMHIVSTSPARPEPPGYWIEVGVCPDPRAADGLITNLLQQNLPLSLDSVRLIPGNRTALRIQVGPFADEARATAVRKVLYASTF